MRICSSIFLSSLLLTGLATSAKAIEARSAETSGSKFGLLRLAQQQEACDLDQKPGCTQRSLRSEVSQLKTSVMLQALVKNDHNDSKSDGNNTCPNRGSGRVCP